MLLKVLGLKLVRVEGVKPERPHPYSQKEAGREDGFPLADLQLSTVAGRDVKPPTPGPKG